MDLMDLVGMDLAGMDLEVPLVLEATAETSSIAVQVGFFLLSLLDDAAIVGLSRLGIRIPGLNWLGTIVCLGVLGHWMWKLGHYLIQREQQRFSTSH